MSPSRGARSLGRGLPRTTLVGVAVVVVALVVIDVVLVALALARTAPEAVGQPRPVPTFGATATAPATPRQSPSATATGGPAADGAGSARHLLSAIDGLEAWRASSATCADPEVVLEHTTDGGKKWQAVELDTDVRTIAALRATSSGVSVLVGTGDACATEVRTSTDDGGTWTDGAAGAAGAGITEQGLALGSDVVDPPCADPADVFRGDSTTLVACDDQLDWRSGTGSWVDVPIDGVRAIAVDGAEYTLARVGTASCDGVQIETMRASGVTAATTTTPIGCNPVPTERPIALDRAGQSVWMWSDGGVAISKNGGATW
ncbi:hypothetical protein C1N91_02435 [Curtobacterium sp. SGAir0471]|uniref:hypothetical protein n=1 Tax=Curtobacterium sp. SGAir0471 TaxID=2070337 RepID=UPI0010CCF836|nr:hypothetical protein [Curtobacterium sp. SGAir0471]QCR42572.1 hypothetical protein C1N91_02435 [Curtobacterium sp. SGAir0471]